MVLYKSGIELSYCATGILLARLLNASGLINSKPVNYKAYIMYKAYYKLPTKTKPCTMVQGLV